MMKRLVAILVVLTAAASVFAEPPTLSWTAHGNRSANSIPLGNGDIGINVWTEQSGDLLLYVGKTDAFDESGRLLKLGRLRVHFSPTLLPAENCRQVLKLGDGVLEIGGRIRVWVDANHPLVHIEAEAGEAFEQTVSLEMWRTEQRPLQHHSERHCVDGPSAHEPPLEYPDTVAKVRDRIVWYHRNVASVYPVTLALQELDPAQCGPDPLLGRTFGCVVAGQGFVSADPTTLKTAAPAMRTHVAVYPLTQQAPAAEWLKSAVEQSAGLEGLSLEETRAAHGRWWNAFWQRSWVCASGGAGGETAAITLGWHANRYLTACTARGRAPVKFNGAIFNVSGIDANGRPDRRLTADARNWGPAFWFQNERHIYWPMLAAGDYEQLLPFFRMYREALPLALHRTQKYYRHEGAFFPETMYFWGAYLNSNYGWNRAGKELGLTDNGYIRRYWQGGLELTAMMLEYERHTADRRFARDTLLPIAAPIVTFYDRHYPRDAQGKLRIEPAQMLETMWDVVNPAPEIAGLNCCLTGLLALPEATAVQRAQWQPLLGELPSLPRTKVGEADVLANAEIIRGGKHNIENGHLYAVWPYRRLGLGVGDLQLAQDSYTHRWHKGGPYQCWTNDTLYAAHVGLAAEATDHLAYRFVRTDGLRFPAFYTHGDWVPDLDNGGVCQNTVQSMLLQAVGERILLLPAWPKQWDVSFRLRAPRETTVTGEVRAGKVVRLEVRPAARRADVQICAPFSE